GTNTDNQTITVTVTDVNDNAPVITSNGGGSTATINVAENSTPVTTVTATDADAGTTLTYSLSGGADLALFTINATNGELAFNSAPEFENPADVNGDNNYEVSVQVSDGTNTDNQTISVAVTDVNEGFSIFIGIPNIGTISLHVYSSDAIQQIKHQIETQESIPVVQQHLYFGGVDLEDGRTLADYNIQHNDTLKLQIVLPITPDANGILYVDSAIATPGDGSSWSKALSSFGIALHAADSINALAGASVHQVWVAKGTYVPVYKVAAKDDHNNPTTDKNKAFVLLNNVQIYGGFASTESALSDR